jgi:radical SAM-linked protein
LRVHYAKRGRLRFTSHRDFQRAFERALRRAAVPMAYSAGFSPHPKVSYVGAAPTGVASESEYLEIAVTRRVDPERLREALDVSLPPGLDIVEILEATPGVSLPDRVDTSRWELQLPGVAPAAAAEAIEVFLAAERVEVERLLKDGRRTLDARSPVVSLGVAGGVDDPPCAILQMVVRHVTPAVRPDDVLTGLREVAGLVPPVPTLVTRLAQGLLDEETGQIADPLAPDREAAATARAVAPQTP